MTKHGGPGAYNKGCRCSICIDAHRTRIQATRARLHTRPREEVPHGTRGGYSNWGCRCQPCRTANTVGNRDSQRRYNAKQRAKKMAAKVND